MILLAYLVAIIIFSLCNSLLGGIIRAIWVLILASLFKIHNAPYRNSTQFIGEFISSIIAYNLSLYSFSWFNKEYNLFLLGIIYTIIFFILTSSSIVDEKYKPNIQKLGMFCGVIVSILLIKNS